MAFSEDPLFGELVDAAVLDQPTAERLLGEHPELIRAKNCLGETALHFLAIENYPEGVAFLARHGADVNTNDGSMTPLMSVALLGTAPLVRQLLALGANPHFETPAGFTVWDFLNPANPAEMRAIFAEHGFAPPDEFG